MTRPQRFETQAWLLLSLICIAVYAVWPELDLRVASWFYTPDVGFDAKQWPWVEAWHMTVPWVGRAMLIGSLLLLAFGQRWTTPAARRQALALAITLVIGLWVILHLGFKDNWGRARPDQITALGGTQAYTSPLVPSSGCDRNCSFMSGHAGTGFVLIAVGALATTRTRRRWLFVGWVAGLGLGWIRMAQGGHFLGDIVFGGLLLWGCAWISRWCYVRWRAWRRLKVRH
jgi:membrane-associated PAP2 superfamily phosphatase